MSDEAGAEAKHVVLQRKTFPGDQRPKATGSVTTRLSKHLQPCTFVTRNKRAHRQVSGRPHSSRGGDAVRTGVSSRIPQGLLETSTGQGRARLPSMVTWNAGAWSHSQCHLRSKGGRQSVSSDHRGFHGRGAAGREESPRCQNRKRHSSV